MAHGPPERRRALVYATILYWQARELPLLERAVASLLAQAGDAFELRLNVIDNGCGATPRLASDSRLEFTRLVENRGFSGGHNAGLRHALAHGADFVLLFNSDAFAQPGCLAALLAAADAAPRAAFVGPVLLRADAPERIESAGHTLNRWARHRELHRGQPAAALGPCPLRVQAVSGCALLARRAAVEAIGLLDETLFAYFEDMDWCLRAGRLDYAVVVAPQARVLHAGAGSTEPSSALPTYYSVRNHMIVAARYGGAIHGRLLMLLALGYHLAFVASSSQRRSARHVLALARGAWAAWTGQRGRCS